MGSANSCSDTQRETQRLRDGGGDTETSSNNTSSNSVNNTKNSRKNNISNWSINSSANDTNDIDDDINILTHPSTSSSNTNEANASIKSISHCKHKYLICGYIRKHGKEYNLWIPSEITHLICNIHIIIPRKVSELSSYELQELKQGLTFWDISYYELEELKQGLTFCNKDFEWKHINESWSNQVLHVMEYLEIGLTLQQLYDIIDDLNNSYGDRIYDFDIFIQIMDHQISINLKKPEIEKQFKIFDKNGDGKITFDELKQTLIELGEIITDEDVMNMIKCADLNGDGTVGFEEFMIMMTYDEDEYTLSLLLST